MKLRLTSFSFTHTFNFKDYIFPFKCIIHYYINEKCKSKLMRLILTWYIVSWYSNLSSAHDTPKIKACYTRVSYEPTNYNTKKNLRRIRFLSEHGVISYPKKFGFKSSYADAYTSFIKENAPSSQEHTWMFEKPIKYTYFWNKWQL